MGDLNRILVESVDLEAQGVAHLPSEAGEIGKVVFIEGALPGELVTYRVTREKARFQKARVEQVLIPASYRRKPPCQWYEACGGCTMQHMDMRAQIAIKQRVLEDNLRHLGKVQPEMILRPLLGPEWQYRYRARFSVVNRSIKKGTVLVGFHERKRSYVVDMTSCEIVPKFVSDLLKPLRALILGLSVRDRVPQIELAIGDLEIGSNRAVKQEQPVLVIRHLLPLTDEDKRQLEAFAKEHGVWLWTQSHGNETAKPFYPTAGKLAYQLPEFGVEIPFRPTDFTQVNHPMNRSLVGRAVRLLDPQSDERVLDLFCGIGNFTLPLATQAKAVLGIEGSRELTQRAVENAKHNHLEDRVSFKEANLFEVNPDIVKSWGHATKWLIDPPRDGAMALSEALAELSKSSRVEDLSYLPKRIVYVSCNPSTLARDAGILVNQAGYSLLKAGVMNMFPHTSHVESIAVFER